MKKLLSIVFLLIFALGIVSKTNFIAYSSDDYYAQYSGSTQADYGYKPDCTFTVEKIVNGKFTGRFAAAV